ncbi:MAG TPA: acetyl-CoA C-acyltransferase [Aquabacterium sp.]|nr:acetyl-CoA C-acyltransferase [Aquabacterium sp.]
MSHSDPIVILSARRTPIGAFLGALSTLTAPQLGAAAIRAALQDSGVPAAEIDEVYLGCCLMAGLGQAPARQAALGAGLPESVGATTLTKMCGSGMKTVMLAHDLLKADAARFLVAGGMESMSNAPYLLPAERKGQRLGHGRTLDHMFYDGLQDAYGGELMGHYAEAMAHEAGLTRAEQDAYALESIRRAQNAVDSGWFAPEVTPVEVKLKGLTTAVDVDETPGQCQPEKVAKLKPVFAPAGREGTVTAASSSSISDGAAALVLTRSSVATATGLQPLARIVAHSTHASTPGRFPSAPIPAIESVLRQTGWAVKDVDLFEINEAFAMVTMLAMRGLALPHDKVNVHGGACALGHPIGATGARILVTLIHALQRRGGRRGIASLCIGGGEATAMAIELV